MRIRGRCLRCGGYVWYEPAPVGVAGPCDLCGQRHLLVDGIQFVECDVVDLTERDLLPSMHRVTPAGR
jgi:hypothetical protein